MASDWEEMRLDEVTELIIDCPHSTPKWMDEGAVVLRSNNIKNGRLDLSSPSFTNEEGYQARVKRAIPKSGDLVLTREAPMGEVCQIPEGLRCCLGQRMVLLRVKKEIMDSTFLLFALQSPYLQHQISWNEGTGTTVSNIRMPNIKAFQIPTPPLPEQKAIAHILGSLDDKIELNRQMNETLEAMAQALFKSWFVDFDPVIDNALAAGNTIPDELLERAEQRKGIEKKDNSDIQDLFPDEFEFTEEMGWIPKGWESGTLADICFFGKGKINTSELSLENYVSTENMNKEKAGISYAASIASTSQVPKFSVGQTLISNIRPYFKKIWLASFSGGRSNDVLGFQANDAVANEYLFSLLYQDSFFDYMTATSKGTKMPRGDKAAIMSWSVAIPPLILMEEFSNKVKPMYLANHIRSTQAVALSELHDTLLHKLMSGELRLPDAETLVYEAV